MSKKWYKDVNPIIYSFRDKPKAVENLFDYQLIRTLQMFRYSGLPDTIPERNLELLLQYNGFAGIIEHDNKLYAVNGGLGGEPDEYYRPTVFTVSNPALKLSRQYTIGKDAVIIRNDFLLMGLTPMHSRYATLMAENELSIYIATILDRATRVFDAPTEKIKTQIDTMLKSLEDGKLGAFLSGGIQDMTPETKTLDYSNSSTSSIIPLIELEQYLKGSWLNEIGLNANWNAKREAIGTQESTLNQDALFPLIDEMLAERKSALDDVNRIFGTSISVELSSAWEDNKDELERAQEVNNNAQTDPPDTGADNPELAE